MLQFNYFHLRYHLPIMELLNKGIRFPFQGKTNQVGTGFMRTMSEIERYGVILLPFCLCFECLKPCEAYHTQSSQNERNPTAKHHAFYIN